MPIIPPEPPPQPPQPPPGEGPLSGVPLNDSLAQQIAANEAKAAAAGGGKSGPVNVPKPDSATPPNTLQYPGQPRDARGRFLPRPRTAQQNPAAHLPQPGAGGGPPMPTTPATPPVGPPAFDVLLARIQAAVALTSFAAAAALAARRVVQVASATSENPGIPRRTNFGLGEVPVTPALPFGVGVARAVAMALPSVMIPSLPMHTDC